MKLYRCDLCGRVFHEITPHVCVHGNYRKRNLTFTEFEDVDCEYVKKSEVDIKERSFPYIPQRALILGKPSKPKIERMEDIQKEANMSKNKVEMFDAIVKKMADTYRKKNADYGDSFGKSIDEFGYTAALVRMSDKFNRLKNLLRPDAEAKVKDESVKDTIIDLACYSVMLAIEVECRDIKKE